MADTTRLLFSSGPWKKREETAGKLFRSDLISAMKLPDSLPMDSNSYMTVKESWRREWEFGVQVCVSPEQMPRPSARKIEDSPKIPQDFRMPPSLYTEETAETQYVEYDIDDMDMHWLEQVNHQRKFRALIGPDRLSEDTFRDAMIALETKCQQNMACAVVTDETLGIEYDEGTVCDVCRDKDSEDTNDMIFCDNCNVCIHQACYGLQTVPKGRWLCRTCSAGEKNIHCMLCLDGGGALKRVRPGNTNWAHLSCALWIPEVKIGNAEKMEPITNTEDIPASRWNLVCCVCRKKGGACVQCCHPHCVTAYHITCAFSSGLETHTRLDVRNNSVIHESYCPKHSPLHRSPTKHSSSTNKTPIHHYSQLHAVRDQFYTYTSPDHLVHTLSLTLKISSLLYNYWRLKRASLHNRPLLSHLPIETYSAGLKAELALSKQFGLGGDPNFLNIIYIRQNLEKARNLVYMVQKRERMKRRIISCRQEISDMEYNLFSSVEKLEVEEEEKEEEVADKEMRDAECMTLDRMKEEEEEEGEGEGEEIKEKEEEEEGKIEEDSDPRESIRQTRSMTQRIDTAPPTHLLTTLNSVSYLPPPLLPPPTLRNNHPCLPPTTSLSTTILNHSLSLPPHLPSSLHPVSSSSSYCSTSSSSSMRIRPAHLPRDHMTPTEYHMMSSPSHMTLRRRDLQPMATTQTAEESTQTTLAHHDTERNIRSKIRRQIVIANGNCSPPLGVKRLTQLPPQTESDAVLDCGSGTSPPARNLRYRPYTVGKM